MLREIIQILLMTNLPILRSKSTGRTLDAKAPFVHENEPYN